MSRSLGYGSTHLHTSAHWEWLRDPLGPNCIHLAELLNVNDVYPSPHNLVKTGAASFEARLDVT